MVKNVFAKKHAVWLKMEQSLFSTSFNSFEKKRLENIGGK